MEWHVWDFPDSICVKFTDEYRINLFEKLRKHFGGYRKISNIGFDYTSIATCLKRGQDSGGYQAYTNVKIIRKIIELFPEEKERLEENIVAYKGRRRANLVYNPVLPMRETPEMYSVACHVIADGSASVGKTPYYSNSRKELLKEFESKLQVFGKVIINSYFYSPTGVTYIMFPKAIADILSHILNVRFAFPNKLPERLFETSDECKKAAIKAMFDDEGTVSTTFAITQKSKNILLQVKKLLSYFEVESGKISCSNGYYNLLILTRSYEKFHDVIGLTSIDKNNNLNEYIKAHKNYIDSLLKTKIYSFLINQHPLNKHQIAEKFHTTPGNATAVLKLLENEGKIKRKFVGINKPLLWYAMA